MHFISLKFHICALLFLTINTTHGSERPKDDIHAHIQAKMQVRNTNIWEPLNTKNTELLYNKPCNMPKSVQINYKGNTLDGAVYGPKYPQGSIPIPYIICTSKHVRTGKVPAKGVIIKVYGGGSALSIQNDHTFCEENLWALENYIVYCLNIRGTPGFGDQFLNAPAQSNAVQDMIRDISYFAYIVKNRKKDVRGQERPIGRELVTNNMPFYLIGASFGGYLTLSHATNPENDYPIKHLGVSICHRTLFTGYIPVLAITDIWKDLSSGTKTGTKRLDLFLTNTKPTWMINAYKDKDIVNNAWDNRVVSPLTRMHLLSRPTLFIIGAKDNNVSPKQTTDCIKEAIYYNNHRNVFLYADGDLGHSFPNGFNQIKPYYEMMFQFMEGTQLAFKTGLPLLSRDSLEKINYIALLKARALNPGICRPKYQFFYQVIKLHYYARKRGLEPDYDWGRLINIQCDFYLKSLVWMKEKEKNNLSHFNHRLYLDQKSILKKAYTAQLSTLMIKDLECDKNSFITLNQYYKKRIYKNSTPQYKTYYNRFIRYLGDGNYPRGLKKLDSYEEKLKGHLDYIIKNYPMDLIVESSIVATRLGV